MTGSPRQNLVVKLPTVHVYTCTLSNERFLIGIIATSEKRPFLLSVFDL